MVVAIGREEWQKGHDTLVDATARLVDRWPDVTVLVAGRPGGQSEHLQAQIERAGLTASVRVLGYRDDVADLLCGADVFAFPSRWEGLGSTLLEAMALEIPIVASDLPGGPRGPDARAGAVHRRRPTPPRSPTASPRASPRPTDARRRAEAARRRFLDEFTAAATARRMRDFYDRALDRNSAA